jgi:hypothetical protein
VYDVFYSFNILNTCFNIGFCITVKRLEQSWFVRYINVYYYYYYYTGTAERESILIFSLMLLRHNEGMHAPMQVPCVDVSDTVVCLDGCARAQ